jgi:hypothetical protein
MSFGKTNELVRYVLPGYEPISPKIKLLVEMRKPSFVE